MDTHLNDKPSDEDRLIVKNIPLHLPQKSSVHTHQSINHYIFSARDMHEHEKSRRHSNQLSGRMREDAFRCQRKLRSTIEQLVQEERTGCQIHWSEMSFTRNPIHALCHKDFTNLFSIYELSRSSAKVYAENISLIRVFFPSKGSPANLFSDRNFAQRMESCTVRKHRHPTHRTT